MNKQIDQGPKSYCTFSVYSGIQHPPLGRGKCNTFLYTGKIPSGVQCPDQTSYFEVDIKKQHYIQGNLTRVKSALGGLIGRTKDV